METKQSIDKMRQIQEGLPYRCMLAVSSIRRSGGLTMLWMEEVDLHIQTFTLNHIDALILNDPNTPWRLTGFYGWPEEQRKNESWHAIVAAPSLLTLNSNIRRETKGTTKTLESHAGISSLLTTLWKGICLRGTMEDMGRSLCRNDLSERAPQLNGEKCSHTAK